MSDFLISPNYHYSDWQKLGLNDEGEWNVAIDIVEDRIKGRFSKWIDQIETSRFSGFAVIALDCLLLETIYGFQQGASTKDTKAAYKSLLTSSFLGFDQATAESFTENVRHGVIHDTETRKGWLIEMSRPAEGIVERDSLGTFVLNRIHFHAALKELLDDWLARLRSGDDIDARQKMKTRMEQIIEKHFSI